MRCLWGIPPTHATQPITAHVSWERVAARPLIGWPLLPVVVTRPLIGRGAISAFSSKHKSKMAKRKHDDAALIADEILDVDCPRQLISLGDHVDELPDMAPRLHKKTKRSRKNKKSKRIVRDSTDDERSTDDEDPRTTVHAAHQLSDSNNSAEFRGYAPVYSRKKDTQKTGRSPNLTSVNLPAWLNDPSPPGPWHRRPQSPPRNPIDSSDPDDSDVEIEHVVNAAPPITEGLRKKDICLDEFMEQIVAEEDVGPNVWPELAKLVEGCWGKHHKEEFKKVCETHKTPGNTPSLQKVVLDPELEAVLGDRYPRAKRTDTALQTIGGVISKTATCLTEVLHMNMSDMSPETATKKIMTTCFDALRILAHGHAKLQHTRRDVIKFTLDPAVSRSLNKNASIENSNATHKLFGGDVHKQAKEGQCFSTVIQQLY